MTRSPMTRFTSLAVLLLMLAGLLPIQPAAAQPSALAIGPEPASRDYSLKVAPVQPVRTPSLILQVEASAATLAVGDTVALTLTLTNRTGVAATNVVVSLPLPAGAAPVDRADFKADTWTWTLPQVDGWATQTFSARMQVSSLPPGAALLARPTVTATELPLPLTAVGGALIDVPAVAGTTAFTPGQSVTLRTDDGRVEVRVPATLASERLQLTYRTLAQQRQANKTFQAPPSVIGFKRGFAPFFLEATDAKGQAVHQFKQPLAINVRYTPEQLEALGIAEADLTIFWYNEQTGQWVPQPTTVDPATRTASTQVDHFSIYGLSDGSSPSESFIPSLQGWQVGLYTGNASYAMPIDVPNGPAGIKPALQLSYSSSASDGKGGTRALGQAGWVGKGWSLDTGSVAYNKLTVNATSGEFVGYYSMVVDGQSFDIMRGASLAGNTGPLDPDPTHWTWIPTNENFNKIAVVPNGLSTASRGGYENGVAQPRYRWQIWTKDGTRYDFAEDMWWGWNNCGTTAKTVDMETYKWQLSSVTDVHSNTINYTYGRYSVPLGAVETCTGSNNSGQATRDLDLWPTAVTWGANLVTGASDRFKIEFTASDRTQDQDWDGAANQYGGLNGQPRETKRLDHIRVYSKPAGAWEQIRRYWLEYDYSLTADNRTSPTERLTLKSIQRIGKDDVSALPKTLFTYGTVPGTGTYVNGDWNRLTTINNGQGGTMTFAYAVVASAAGTNNTLANYRRVTSKTSTDGRGNSATTSYVYTNPATNSLGTILDTSSSPIQQYANSAALYYNKYVDPATDNSAWLQRKAYGEFRGHSKVVETTPDGAKTEHYFYQGDVDCNPTLTGMAITAATDPLECFVKLRNREILKGREWKTVVLSAANATLASTTHTFTVDFGATDYGVTPLSGLWRSFSYESETSQATYNGNATPITRRTTYTYDPTLQGGTQRGNVTHVRQYDAANVLYRTTETTYQPNTSTVYIVDRPIQEVVRNGSNHILTLTSFMYDGATTSQGMGTRGLMTLVRKYLNIPSGVTSLTGLTLQSSDTSSGYDAYGNRLSITTYAAAGTRTNNGNTFSAPGNGSAATVTTTVYDNPVTTTVDEAAWGLSIKVVPPTVNGVTLTEHAAYDYRMGTLISVTDPNGTVTGAEYDAFGRMSKLIQPGDTSAIPTVSMEYGDSELPSRYTTFSRIESGVSGSVQRASQFYDGLGRRIQTKTEIDNNTKSSVVDTQYNYMDQPYREYRPRLQADSDVTILQYTPTPSSGVYSTTTTYDVLGRMLTTLEPNGARTLHTYGVVGSQTYHDVVDPNRHRTQQRSDIFGRLTQVDEITGNCGAYLGYPCDTGDVAWAVAASTVYGYSPLDLLTGVTDAAGNQTTMTYDSLGRKKTMSDPDMGAWSYTYDVDDNLLTQTDAKSQTITFAYDALDRLTSKAVPGSGTVTYGYDETLNPFGSYNKGLRTSMTDASGTQTWEHDQRGQVMQEFQSIIDQGVTYQYTTGYGYDARGLLKSLTYPTGETLTATYDDAGQQKTIISSYGTTYLASATYDAFGQTLTEGYGNSTTTTNTYYATDARLYNRHVTAPGGATLFRRYYTYDLGGNVRSTDSVAVSPAPAETLRFFYDERDRLTTACAVSGVASNTCLGGATFNQSYAYNTIGNLTSKAGVAYTYPTNGVRPHAVSTVGGQTYTYDSNGNLLSGGGRTFTWNAENRPSQIVKGTTTETYTYNGENERVLKVSTVGGVTTRTRYIGSLLEVTGTTTISSYEGVAIRTVVGTYSTGNPGTVLYLHGDHLGSVSLTTNASGALVQSQTFDPWGTVRTGGVTSTEYNYTGQRKDAGTGLLFYNARYYDPVLGRFLSADGLVPNAYALTTDAFAADGSVQPQTPINPQDLNRYSYVLNNPLRYTDPSGHQSQGSYADVLISEPQSQHWDQKDDFPLQGGPKNGAYYRTDENGNVRAYAEYDENGNMVRRTERDNNRSWHSHDYETTKPDPKGVQHTQKKRDHRGKDPHRAATVDEIPTKNTGIPGRSQPRSKPPKNNGGSGNGGSGKGGSGKGGSGKGGSGNGGGSNPSRGGAPGSSHGNGGSGGSGAGGAGGGRGTGGAGGSMGAGGWRSGGGVPSSGGGGGKRTVR